MLLERRLRPGGDGDHARLDHRDGLRRDSARVCAVRLLYNARRVVHGQTFDGLSGVSWRRFFTSGLTLLWRPACCCRVEARQTAARAGIMLPGSLKCRPQSLQHCTSNILCETVLLRYASALPHRCCLHSFRTALHQRRPSTLRGGHLSWHKRSKGDSRRRPCACGARPCRPAGARPQWSLEKPALTTPRASPWR